MEKIKKLLSWQNFVILFLLVIVILLAIIAFKYKGECKAKEETVNNNYLQIGENQILCQREYFFNSSDSYMFAVCGNKLYVSKNNEEYKELPLDNISYMHNFISLEETSFYFLKTDGTVSYLSSNTIIDETYEINELDLENIVTIHKFYTGYNKEDAYNSGIYAVDKKGNMTLIK